MERFRDFLKVAATLSADEFFEHFPHPMLLFSEQPGALDGIDGTRLVDSGGGSESIDRFSELVMDFMPLLPNPKPSRDFPRKCFLGRDPRRDFVLAHNTVSSRHACLFLDESADAWMLVDSGSTNGTRLRGKPLDPGEPVRLHEGDVITFGKVDVLFFSPRAAYRYLHQYRLFRDAMRQQR